jgi:hypothetical protein
MIESYYIVHKYKLDENEIDYIIHDKIIITISLVSKLLK